MSKYHTISLTKDPLLDRGSLSNVSVITRGDTSSDTAESLDTYLVQSWLYDMVVVRRAPVYVLLVAFLSVSVVMLQTEVSARVMLRHARKESQTAMLVAVATLDAAYACSNGSADHSGEPIPIPSSFDMMEYILKKRNWWSSAMPVIDQAKQELSSGQCQACLVTLHKLYATLVAAASSFWQAYPVETMADGFYMSLNLGALAHNWLLQLASELPLLKSLVALTGVSSELICIPTVGDFVSIQSAAVPVMQCAADWNDAILEVVQLKSDLAPQREWIELLRLKLLYFSDKSFVYPDDQELNRSFGKMSIIIAILSILSIVFLGVQTRRRLQEDAVRNRMCMDFARHGKEKIVTVRRDTMALLDHYCWRLGDMESVDPDIVAQLRRAGHVTHGAPQQGQQCAEAAQPPAVPRVPSPKREVCQSPCGVSLPARQFATIQQQSEARHNLLARYAHEYEMLASAYQIQLLMHQAVSPMLLVRPYVPAYMRYAHQLSPEACKGLGSVPLTKVACTVLREGLDESRKTFLFLSFHHYNSEAVVSESLSHYRRRNILRSDVLRAVQIERQRIPRSHHLLPCWRQDRISALRSVENSLHHEVIRTEDSEMAWPTTEVGGRLAEHWERQVLELMPGLDLANPDAYHDGLLARPKSPEFGNAVTQSLSSVAIGLNYTLECVRAAAETFSGEVVQVSSDGVLVQFPEHEAVQESEFRPQRNDPSSRLLRSNTVPEERAVRAASAVQRDLSECDFLTHGCIPCPIVISSEEECLSGCVPFHVSKHYCVLARCIPLLLALGDIAVEHGASIVTTARVVDIVKPFTMSFPIHFLEVNNLNIYRLHALMADTAERLDDGSGKVGHASSGLSIPAKDSPTTYPLIPTKKVVSEEPRPDETSAADSHLKDKNFSVALTVYTILQVCPLGSTTAAYRLYHDENFSVRLRSAAWESVWLKYRAIWDICKKIPHLHNYVGKRTHESVCFMPAEHEKNVDVTSEEQQEQDTAGSLQSEERWSGGRSGRASFARRSDMQETFTRLRYSSVSGLHMEFEFEADLMERLSAFHDELQAFRTSYGLRSWEECAYRKMLEYVEAVTKILQDSVAQF